MASLSGAWVTRSVVQFSRSVVSDSLQPHGLQQARPPCPSPTPRVYEKEMATHSSVLAWRIPGMGEPGGLPSLGSHRVGHDWSNLAAAAACPLSRWCHPTISSSVIPFSSHLQSLPASGSFPISVFFFFFFFHQVAKVLELQLQHQSFQWTLRTDFLRMDWFDFFAVQGSLKSFLQHHSSKA